MKNNRKAITVVYLPTPFQPVARKEATIDVDPRERIEDAVSRAFPGIHVNTFAVRGKILSAGDAAVMSDEWFVWVTPRDAITAIVAAVKGFWALYGGYIAAGFFAASIGYSVYSYLQAKKQMAAAKNAKYGKEVSDVSDENYGWDYDARNATSEGSPLPILYGERMVIPPIIQSRNIVSPLSGKEFMEAIFGVCQGGAGFADVVTYPTDTAGDLDVRLNHANWKNYISMTQFENDSSQAVNRINSGIAIYNGVYYQNGALQSYATANTTNLTDGNTTTYATGLADSQDYDSRNSPAKAGTGGDKYTRNFYFVLAEPCEINQVKMFVSRKDTRFNVYAGNSNDITQYVLIGSFPGNGLASSWKVCNCDTKGKFYQYVLITDFRYSTDARFYELECYGSINLSAEDNITGYAEVEARPGSYNQSPLAICRNVWSSLSVSKGLDLSWFTFSTSIGATPDSLACYLEFPYGLYDSSGASLAQKTVKIACEWRGVTDAGVLGSWTKFNSNFDAASVIEITDTTTSPKKVQFVTDEHFPYNYDHYEIRMKFAEDPQFSSLVVGACNWTGLDEGYNHQPSYPKTAVVGVRLMATESLYGSMPQVKVTAARNNLMVYNPIDGEWQIKPANNPAWVAWDMIVRPVFDDSGLESESIIDSSTGELLINPASYLREEAFPRGRVQYSDFAAWADFCEAEAITMSMYFDGTSSVSECLQYVLDIGRAGIVNRGNVLGVVVDKAADTRDAEDNPVPLFIFDETNIVAGTFKTSYRDRSNYPTEIIVAYYDKNREYTRKTVQVRSSEDNHYQNTKDITLYCCDDAAVAKSHADYIIKQNLIKRVFNWTGDLDSMPLDIGDLVKVNENLAVIGSVTFDDEMRREFTAVEYVDARFS